MFQQLDGQLGANKWEGTILNAFQTWAENSNINIGQVSDGGQTLGIAGPAQGDARFGDIRVSAIPLPAGVAAITSPYNPSSGTLSGDMILNSNLNFNSTAGYDLFTVALHEAGHSFGFADSDDPSSFMYDVYTGPQTGLAPGAIPALQALYGGPRDIVDRDGLASASDPTHPLDVSAQLTSTTTAGNTAAGDLATPGSANYYQFKLSSYGVASGGVTVQVQTAGVSQLIPRVTITDQSGNVVGSAAAVATTDGGVSVNILAPQVGSTYTVKVDAPSNDLHSVGSYVLSVAPTYNYSSMSAGMNSATSIDSKNNSTQGTTIGTGSVVRTNQVNFYSFTTPSIMLNGFTAQLQVFGVGLTTPQLAVVNSRGVVIGQASASDATNTSVTIHITNPSPNAKYYLRVATGLVNSYQTGVYQVATSFGSSTSNVVNSILQNPWLGSITAKLTTPNTGLNNAATLQTPAGYDKGDYYSAMEGIGSQGTANYFDITLPRSNQRAYMTVSVQAINGSSFIPWVQVTDKNGSLVAGQVLAQAGGSDVIQVPYDPGTSDYYVKVGGSVMKGAATTGNYYLTATFGSVGANLGLLSAGSIGPVATNSTATPIMSSLTTPSTSLYEFVLAGDPTNSASDALIRMTVTDSAGHVVATLTTPVTEAASLNVLLAADQYSIAVDVYSPSGASIPTILYNLSGTNLTDPIKVYGAPGAGSSTTQA